MKPAAVPRLSDDTDETPTAVTVLEPADVKQLMDLAERNAKPSAVPPPLPERKPEPPRTKSGLRMRVRPEEMAVEVDLETLKPAIEVARVDSVVPPATKVAT
ncbi:hypothetical protein AKJ09_06494 [Labilithrix luteola]|uniref:Uncharacterized protein n=1 Tax=Labilithrix luteola TaxID=1391654 RepID=A0A0K1Q1Z9_9BACT|nr:hypothetical protein [Labilithrix luteola]AKU99830.1 hypothetical protein AKJ09_06494 [Labilithrix luteola]